MWKKKLEKISKNKITGFKFSKDVLVRVNLVMTKRLQDQKVAPPPGKGMGFFPFEEDLWNHINECLVTISTGCTISFFDNPYVRDLLSGLNPRHRPVYRLKLVRLQRCCNDVLQKEVSLTIILSC